MKYILVVIVFVFSSCKKDTADFLSVSIKFSNGKNVQVEYRSDEILVKNTLSEVNDSTVYTYKYEIGNNRQISVFAKRNINDTGFVSLILKYNGTVYTDSTYGYNGISASISKIL